MHKFPSNIKFYFQLARAFLRKIKLFLLKTAYRIHNFIRYGSVKIFSGVEIETNSKCNRRCAYCPNSLFNRGEKLIKEGVYYKIIQELKDLHYMGQISPHFYGEPLLDKRLPQLLSYTKKYLPYSHIRIYTNGDFLTKQLFTTLVRAGVHDFLITGHGGNMPEHIKKLMSTDLGKQMIHFNTIDQNKTPLFNRGGLVKPKKQIVMKNCILASEHLVIDCQGNIILCCNDYLSSIKFGNVNEEKIIDVWRRKEFRKIRNETKRGKYMLDICRQCNKPL